MGSSALVTGPTGAARSPTTAKTGILANQRACDGARLGSTAGGAHLDGGLWLRGACFGSLE